MKDSRVEWLTQPSWALDCKSLHLRFTTYYLSDRVLLNLSMAQFPHLQNGGDNSTYLIGFLRRLSELICINFLE